VIILLLSASGIPIVGNGIDYIWKSGNTWESLVLCDSVRLEEYWPKTVQRVWTEEADLQFQLYAFFFLFSPRDLEADFPFYIHLYL
jgi:hypothetical protein